METREAERVLHEQVGSMPELRGVQTRLMVVTGDLFDGILRAATDVKADLIVMGSHRKQLLLDIFTGTTIERVTRKGSSPVLMVHNEAQRRYEKALPPVDMSESSARALRVALKTGLIRGGATLLHAFLALAKGKMFVAGIDQASIDGHVASARQQSVEEFASFLIANDFGREKWSLRVDEGSPIEVISRAVEEVRSDLLVGERAADPGLLKSLTGSVTEGALRSISVDIPAVPPVKQ